MPIYDLPTIDYYPQPELCKRELFRDCLFESVLDVGAGHGGVFDLEFWQSNPFVKRKAACDIAWIRDLPPGWETKLGVDVCELDKHYGEREFDFVQCTEVLEHVANSRQALEQLIRVARKAVFITSADETAHIGPEQEAIEQVNRYQAYIMQPRIDDLKELGFSVRVESRLRRQIVAWSLRLS